MSGWYEKRRIKFAVLGDCHSSLNGNYSTRNCSGAKKQLERILERLNEEKLDFVLSLGDLGDGHNSDEVLAHNKTLAAQLCTEFREFFPENAVEYFVVLSQIAIISEFNLVKTITRNTINS